MKRLLLLVTLASSPAYASRCPHGEILRVHMHRCVSVRSSLAALYVHHAFVRLHPAPQHHRLSHGRCDPRTMCGDPVEDKVVDPPSNTPPQTGGMTPRDDWTPEVPALSPALPGDYIRSLGSPHVDWRL